KVDQIAAGRQDPAGLQQLEAGIASLRDVMGQVASGDALASLAHDVRTLAERIERGVPAAGGPDILDALDQRIGALADATEAVRRQATQAVQAPLVAQAAEGGPNGHAAVAQVAHLEELIHALGDRIEHLQASPVDSQWRDADHLEQLIHALGEKLEHLQAPPV